YHQFTNTGILNTFHGISTQHRMNNSSTNIRDPLFHQTFSGIDKRTGSADLIIKNNGTLAFDISNNVIGYRGVIISDSSFADDTKWQVQQPGIFFGSFGAAGIRRDHNGIFNVGFSEVIDQYRSRKQVIGWNMEESLNLERMQIHG